MELWFVSDELLGGFKVSLLPTTSSDLLFSAVREQSRMIVKLLPNFPAFKIPFKLRIQVLITASQIGNQKRSDWCWRWCCGVSCQYTYPDVIFSSLSGLLFVFSCTGMSHGSVEIRTTQSEGSLPTATLRHI